MARRPLRRMVLAMSWALLSAGAARACGPIPFDVYVSQTETALASATLGDDDRSLAVRRLSEAREDHGPKWGGPRQRALNLARRRLGLPAAGNPPLEELGPRERAAAERHQAKLTLGDVDSLASGKSAEELRSVSFNKRRDEIKALFARRDWNAVVSNGLRLEIDLGAAPPAKC